VSKADPDSTGLNPTPLGARHSLTLHLEVLGTKVCLKSKRE